MCSRENVQNVLENRHFTAQVKCLHFLAHFGRFLKHTSSFWTDFFCIESGYLRHKFRVPTRHILEIRNFNFILHFTPLEGGCKIFYGGKKTLPDGPYTIGNQIRWVQKYIMTQRGEWDTLVYLSICVSVCIDFEFRFWPPWRQCSINKIIKY